MDILKRENWWVWLILTLFTDTSSALILAALLKCYDKNAWYADYKNWVLGFLCLIFPGMIMILILIIQMTCEVSKKLGVKGSEIYYSPYTWILCIIFPVIGWICLMVLILYLNIWNIIMISKGKAEKYIAS